MRYGRKIIRAVTVLFLLHCIFAFYRLLPILDNYDPYSFYYPMGELILLYILVNGKRFSYPRWGAALIILAFLVFFTGGELFFRLIYLEPFDMLSDMRYIPGLFVMLIPEKILPVGIIRAGSVILTVLLTVLSALLVLSGIKKGIGKAALSFNASNTILLTFLAFLMMFLFPSASPFLQSTVPGPLSLYAHQRAASSFIDPVKTPAAAPADIPDKTHTAVEETVIEPEWAFPPIEDSDIHFAVIESYGAVLFQKPEYTGFIMEEYKRLQPLLTEDCWTVRTGFVLSPAFGGRSWLADATLLTGEQIVDQRVFDKRLERGEPAHLLTLLKNAGYLSYYIAPGSTRASEEWKKAYPFDTYYLQSDFGYEGPLIGFGKMTDQYIYDFTLEDIIQEDQKEFAFYLLVSSHTPFVRIPVYKADWDFPLKGREYEDGYIRYFENNWLHGNELAQGYLEGIAYSLETTIRYLTEQLPDKEFMLIIGDHQPRKPISGPDPGYPVPFHIIYPAFRNLSFPDDWVLSKGLVPPELPENYNDLPRMAAIPDLIEKLIR